MDNNQQTTSWTAVIIMLIIFWPIGLVLLFKKLNGDRSAQFSGGGVITVIGWILIVFGISGIAMMSDGSEMIGPGIMMIVIFGVPGFFLIKKGRKTKKQAEKSRRYIQLIVNEQVTDIQDLALRTRQSREQVINEVSDMMSKGTLGSARFNKSMTEIEIQQRTRRRHQPVNPHPAVQPSNTRHSEPSRRREEPVKTFEPRSIRCSACSAINFVDSLPAQCEYCGSSLHD